MKRFAVLLIALLASSTLHAQPACTPKTTYPISVRDETRLQWTPSTWSQDGLPIPAPIGSTVTYTVYRAGVAQCTTTSLVQVSMLLQPVGANTYYVTAKSPQTTPPNVETAMSNTASKTIPPPVIIINPPTNLTVIADPTAYEIRGTTTLSVARVGRVELGTACTDESKTVAGVAYNRIDTRAADLVVWPSASPVNVKLWAKCG
jgi:hypothetical protein